MVQRRHLRPGGRVNEKLLGQWKQHFVDKYKNKTTFAKMRPTIMRIAKALQDQERNVGKTRLPCTDMNLVLIEYMLERIEQGIKKAPPKERNKILHLKELFHREFQRQMQVRSGDIERAVEGDRLYPL